MESLTLDSNGGIEIALAHTVQIALIAGRIYGNVLFVCAHSEFHTTKALTVFAVVCLYAA